MANENTKLYKKLHNESVDYGSIYKEKTSEKYYYVPYSEEEKWVKFIS